MRAISTPKGTFIYDRNTGNCFFTNTKKADKWLKPLYAQIALTQKCNLSCWHCYADSSPNNGCEWPIGRLKWLIQFLDAWGIFGVAYGGGEPFMYPHLCEIAQYTWKQTGLDVSITTNGHAAKEEQIKQLEGYVGEVRISIRRLNDCKQLSKFLHKKFEVGVNLLLYKGSSPVLEDIVERCTSLGIKDFLVNSFVATGRGTIYADRTPIKEDFVEFSDIINKHMDEKGLTVKVSARLAVNLQPHLKRSFQPFQDEEKGRILSITADGKLKPSSMAKESYPFKDESQIIAIYRKKIVL
ncbi:MAG: radical SAM protein [Candidatus Bathyarchaeia archaeon]